MTRRYSKQAKKFLARQEEAVEVRIRKAVDKLPLGDVVKIKGEPDTFRLRVGDFRILFIKQGSEISVRKIDSRGQAYKD